MPARLISILRDTPPASAVIHFQGMPPVSRGDRDERQRLDPPAYLLIEPATDGTFLYRFTRSGACVGDTWHRSAAEARAQAKHEYGDAAGPWLEVPGDMEHAHDYALAVLASGG